MSVRIDRGRVQLLTRTGLDWSDKYPSVIAVLANVRAKSAYLDGELCGVGDNGLPSFSRTQAASDGERGVRLVYYSFDLLHLDGRDTASLPLIERKALLEPLIADISGLQFNGHQMGDGQLIRYSDTPVIPFFLPVPRITCRRPAVSASDRACLA
jgi:ATP-dependent DNA ligase